MSLAIDWASKHINVTAPQTDLLIQDLLDFIREQEATDYGITFNQIASASGKEDLGGSVYVGITVELLDGWQLHFWEGSYVATVAGGNLVGGISGDPIAYTAGVQVVLLQSAASTIVVSSGGITPQDKTDIIDGVADHEIITSIKKATVNDAIEVNQETTIYEDDGITIWRKYDTTKTSPGNARRVEIVEEEETTFDDTFDDTF